MQFRIWVIFYVMALVAASLATFGPGGLMAAAFVIAFWAIIFNCERRLQTILWLVAIALIGCCCLLPATQRAYELARSTQCKNNLRCIALALRQYHDTYGSLPPACITDQRGKPMHSWRVLILPYLGEAARYQKYRFDEPWNGPNNRKLAANMPDIYACPSASFGPSGKVPKTHYVAVVGPQTVWPPGGKGFRLDSLHAAGNKTLLLVETTGPGVDWMEPRDISFDDAVNMLGAKRPQGPFFGHPIGQGFFYAYDWTVNMALADGSVRLPASLAHGLLQTDGGDGTSVDFDRLKYTAKHILWSRVYSFALFVFLCILPVVACFSRRGRRGVRP